MWIEGVKEYFTFFLFTTSEISTSSLMKIKEMPVEITKIQ